MAANASAPSGFITVRRIDGAAPNYAVQEQSVAYNYGTRINWGDPVYRYTDGTIRLYANGGTTVHGIFRGCKYLDPGTNRPQWFSYWSAPTLPSTTSVICWIDADPNMTFQCQYIGSALTQSSVGLNVDITSSTSGTTTSLIGISTCSLGGSAAATATLPFRIVSIVGLSAGVAVPAINSAYIGTNDNQWLEVVMNTSDSTTRTGQA